MLTQTRAIKNQWRRQDSGLYAPSRMNFPPNGCVLYAPLWRPELGVSPFNAWDLANSTVRSCIVTGAPWDATKGYTFSGDDQILLPSGFDTVVSTHTQGTIIFWVRPTALVSATIYSFFSRGGADIALAEAFSIHFRAASGVYYFSLVQAQPNFTLPRGSTAITTNNWYCCAISSDGSAYYMEVNGVVQTITMTLGTNNGNWIGNDNPAAPKSYIGMNYYDGTLIEPFVGDIKEGIITSPMLPLAQRQYYYRATKWRYS